MDFLLFDWQVFIGTETVAVVTYLSNLLKGHLFDLLGVQL